MAKDTWFGGNPNLTKLPKHIRDALTQVIPIQPNEILASLFLFKDPRLTGLNIPNSRLHIRGYTPDEVEKARNKPAGIQLEFVDPSGKHPIAMSIVAKEKIPLFLTEFFKAVASIGVSVEEIDKMLATAKTPASSHIANIYGAREEYSSTKESADDDSE